MRARRAMLAGCALSLVAVISGCAPALPTWETVRQEARDATDGVAALLPAGSDLMDLSTEDPFGCEGDGVIYTAHLAAYTSDDFDGDAFLAAIPDELGEDWVIDTDTIESTTPRVRLRSNGMILSAAIVDDDGRPAVDILATSRCGQMPAAQAP